MQLHKTSLSVIVSFATPCTHPVSSASHTEQTPPHGVVFIGEGRAMFSYWMDRETRQTHASLAGTQWGWRWVQISEDDYYRAKANGGRMPIIDGSTFDGLRICKVCGSRETTRGDGVCESCFQQWQIDQG